MAKPPASDSIMPIAKLKSLLSLSKHEPVQAAFALSAEGEAILFLDKKAKPRAVLGMLKGAASKARITLNTSSVRFGRAEVDPDYDPGTVRFFINKDAPGVARVRLTEVMKRIPYQKVELNVDPALEEEPGAEADAAPDAAAADAPEPDLAALRASFTALIPQIAPAAGADPARLAAHKTLAAEVNTHIKANDPAAAAAALAQLQRAIAAAPAPGPAGAQNQAAGAAVRVAKGLLLWNATRSHVDQQLKTLEAAILAQTQDEPDFDAIRDNAGAIYAVLERLDDSLTGTLNDLRGATDPAKKQALSEDARNIVTGYQRFVANDELMADIDDNGFVPLDIKPRVTAALDAVLHVL